MLEVGYGSGIFMPTLAARCDELHGIDIHARNQQVAERVRWHGVRASLDVGTVEESRIAIPPSTAW